MGKKKKDEQKRFYLNKYFELKKDFLEFEEIIVSKFQYFSLEDVLIIKSSKSGFFSVG